jgi:hypothetical protein
MVGFMALDGLVNDPVTEALAARNGEASAERATKTITEAIDRIQFEDRTNPNPVIGEGASIGEQVRLAKDVISSLAPAADGIVALNDGADKWRQLERSEEVTAKSQEKSATDSIPDAFQAIADSKGSPPPTDSIGKDAPKGPDATQELVASNQMNNTGGAGSVENKVTTYLNNDGNTNNKATPKQAEAVKDNVASESKPATFAEGVSRLLEKAGAALVSLVKGNEPAVDAAPASAAGSIATAAAPAISEGMKNALASVKEAGQLNLGTSKGESLTSGLFPQEALGKAAAQALPAAPVALAEMPMVTPSRSRATA